ncbi:MAG: GNAT family N-acetyltransferase [Deltaproteobacteria bacterium]|nr:GNAT family N-acetyltransferase [Deltaproteobacteria bacterium]
MLIVRGALPQDDARVGELLVEAFVETYARKMPEVVVDENRKRDLRDVATKRGEAAVLVAELDGAVVGPVAVFKLGSPQSQAWLPNAVDLRHLAVDPRCHGRGISKALLDRAEALAREEWKVSAICLHVRRGAVGVARLYLSRGYQRDPAGDLAKPTVFLEGYALRF